MLGIGGNSFLESSLSIPLIFLANHRGLDPKFNVGSLLHAPKNLLNRFQMLVLCDLGKELKQGQRSLLQYRLGTK